MTSSTRTAFTRVTDLGELAEARGTFQPSAYTVESPDTAIPAGKLVLTQPRNFIRVDEDTTLGVSCMDDRLRSPFRLAGGALSLALMLHFLTREGRFSANLRSLKSLGFYLKLHEDCGALALWLQLVRQLTDVNAEGYKVLAATGIEVTMPERKEIAAWAATLTADYLDLDAAITVIDEFEPSGGTHMAGYGLIIDRDQTVFDGRAELERLSGLKTFGITTWVARSAAARMTNNAQHARLAAILAQLFSAQALLALGGPGLITALVSR